MGANIPPNLSTHCPLIFNPLVISDDQGTIAPGPSGVLIDKAGRFLVDKSGLFLTNKG